MARGPFTGRKTTASARCRTIIPCEQLEQAEERMSQPQVLPIDERAASRTDEHVAWPQITMVRSERQRARVEGGGGGGELGDCGTSTT